MNRRSKRFVILFILIPAIIAQTALVFNWGILTANAGTGPPRAGEEYLYPKSTFMEGTLSAVKRTDGPQNAKSLFSKLKKSFKEYKRNVKYNSLTYLNQYLNYLEQNMTTWEQKSILQNQKIDSDFLSEMLRLYGTFSPNLFDSKASELPEGGNCVTLSLNMIKNLELVHPTLKAYPIACSIVEGGHAPYYEDTPNYHHMACALNYNDSDYFFLDPSWPFNQVIHLRVGQSTEVLSLDKKTVSTFKIVKDSLDLIPKIQWVISPSIYDESNDFNLHARADSDFCRSRWHRDLVSRNKQTIREFPLTAIINPIESILRPTIFGAHSLLVVNYDKDGETENLLIIDLNSKQLIIQSNIKGKSKKKKIMNFQNAVKELPEIITSDIAKKLGYKSAEILKENILQVIKWSNYLLKIKEIFRGVKGLHSSDL